MGKDPVELVLWWVGGTRHAEARAIKLITFDKGAFGRVGSIGTLTIRRQVVVEIKSFSRDASESAALGLRIFPELAGRTRVRIATRLADDGYCLSHLTPPSREQKPVTVRSHRLLHAHGA
mgnify:CR=1 FL=1